MMALSALNPKRTASVMLSRRLSALSICLVYMGIICAPSAFAGFQWREPVEPQAEIIPLVPGIPLGGDGNAPIQLPSLTESKPPAPMPRQDMSSMILAPLPLAPVAPPLETVKISAPVSKTSTPPEKLVLQPGVGAPLEGFARSVPLVVALKQVLPPDYGFTLDKSVSSATSVSWEGGKPWRAVLQAMVADAKLAAREEGKIIKIYRAGLDGAAMKKMPKADPVIAPLAEARPQKLPVKKLSPPAPEAAAAPAMAAPLPPAVPKLMPQAEKKPVVAAKNLPAAQETPPPLQYPSLASSTARESGEPSMPVADKMPEKDELKPPSGSKSEAAAALPLPPVPPGELVSPSTAMPKIKPTVAEVWRAEPGERLHNVIGKWCARANVELVWATEYDYPIQASMNFSGSFEDAVRGLLTGFVDAKPQPYGRLHDNPSVGQRTLVVESRGNTNNE